MDCEITISGFIGDPEKVYDDLQLYRVDCLGHVTHLVAAHSYAEARSEVRRVWPNLLSAKVWSHAGPATEHNLKGWQKEIINKEGK